MLNTPIGLAVADIIGAAAGGMTISLTSTLESTAAATSYAASAFTPAANSFLVAFVAVTASAVNGTMTGGGLTWTRQGGAVFGATNQHRIHCFTAEVGGSPASTTPTFDCTGDAGTACLIQVYEVGGLNATEIGEIVVNNAGGGGTDDNPSVNYASADATALCLAAFASIEATDPTIAEAPTGWTGYSEVNQASPTCGMGSAYKNTGESGTAVTFQGEPQLDWGIIALQLNPA